MIVRVTGADRIFAFKSELTIPLEHVVGAAKDEDEARGCTTGLEMREPTCQA